MPQVIITEQTTAPAAAQALTRDIVIGVVGETTHVPAVGAGYVVPAEGALTLIESEEQARVFGGYADGTLPEALSVLEANGNFRIAAIRSGAALSVTEALEELEDAQNVLGVRPSRITTAEMAHEVDTSGDIDNTVANDVVAKVEEVCEALDAIGFVGGPNGTLAEFTGWLQVNASGRIFGSYPRVNVPGQATPMYSGPAWCGGHAARQRRAGFWANPHGAQALGISSLETNVRYNIADPASQSSVLTNANGVSFYRRSGWHLMGNRLMALPTATGPTIQGTGRVVVDDLRHFLETSSDDALEQNIQADYYDHVITTVTNRINFLRRRGALRSGSIVADPALNTPSEESAGRTHFVITIEVVKNVEEVHYLTVIQ